jgi:hypothetical protein
VVVIFILIGARADVETSRRKILKHGARSIDQRLLEHKNKYNFQFGIIKIFLRHNFYRLTRLFFVNFAFIQGKTSISKSPRISIKITFCSIEIVTSSLALYLCYYSKTFCVAGLLSEIRKHEYKVQLSKCVAMFKVSSSS